MSVARWMGLCTVLVMAASAYADPRPRTLEELQACEAVPERDTSRSKLVAENVLYTVARSGKGYVVFGHMDDSGCDVYPLARPVAQLSGQFETGSRVVALRQPDCRQDVCGLALAVLGKNGAPLAAMRTDAVCDYYAALDRMRLFPGRDTAKLTCRTGTAGGWQEQILIVDVLRDTLATIYDLHTGNRAPPTPAERKAGDCGTYPVGGVRVEKAACIPLLRVIDPAWGELYNSKGTLPARQLRYDADRKGFVPTGAPDIPTVVDGRTCRRRE